jgi:hypothetical protein
MSSRLTPLMETALRAMTRGELHWTVGIGWRSSIGIEGIWNAHTIKWLAGHGYCRLQGARASITTEGRNALAGVEGWAA